MPHLSAPNVQSNVHDDFRDSNSRVRSFQRETKIPVPGFILANAGFFLDGKST